jgi:uncharacterized protein YjeT (DUF2065 family)
MSLWVIIIGLVFVTEGLIWLLAPLWFRKVLNESSPLEMRIYGGIVAAAGLMFMWSMS